MKSPGELQGELANELSAMKAAAEKVRTALDEMAAMAQEVPAQVKKIVERWAAWDQDVRVHGERIAVKDPKAGTVVDLSRDQLFIGMGGGDIEAGALYINEAHDLPGGGTFRPATELEVQHVKARLGQGRVEIVMNAAAQIGR